MPALGCVKCGERSCKIWRISCRVFLSFIWESDFCAYASVCVCVRVFQTAGTLTLFPKLFPSWILFLAQDEAIFPTDSAMQCK